MVGDKFVQPPPPPPPPPLSHHTNVCKISRVLGSCIYVSFQQITLTLGNFINFKAPFYVVSTDFPELSIHVKRLKKTVNRSFQLI